MNHWAEVRAELDQMLELERDAARQRRQQQWNDWLLHSKRLHAFLIHLVQWLGRSRTVSSNG